MRKRLYAALTLLLALVFALPPITINVTTAERSPPRSSPLRSRTSRDFPAGTR